MPGSRLDIVMVSRNEAAVLPYALTSLKRQTTGPGAFRLFFVDSASQDNTREVVEAHQEGLNLVFMRAERAGTNIARQLGLDCAETELVAFLDSDVLARPNWVETILRVGADAKPDLLGGPYYPYYISPKPDWYLDRYGTFSMGNEVLRLGPAQDLRGANMIWRRELLEGLGGFNPSFLPTGRGWTIGDETEIMMRAWAHAPNLHALYHPDVAIEHIVRPRMFSLRYWAHRRYLSGYHQRVVFQHAGRFERYSDAALAGRALAIGAWMPLAALWAAVFRDRRQFPHLENYVFERVLPRMTWLGGFADRLHTRLPHGRRARSGTRL